MALLWHVAASSPQYGENTAFFQFSLWQDPRLRHFAGYSLGASGGKASTTFQNTALSLHLPNPRGGYTDAAHRNAPSREWLFSFPQYSEYIAFLPNFPSAGFMTDHLLGYSFGTSRKHHPLPVAEPNEKPPIPWNRGLNKSEHDRVISHAKRRACYSRRGRTQPDQRGWGIRRPGVLRP